MNESLVPLVCVPDAIAREDRAAHFALGKRLFLEVAEEREDLPDGMVLRLPVDALPDTTRFIANERKCCPFLQIGITIAASASAFELKLTGPIGTRELIDAELGLGTSSCSSCA